MAVSELKQRSEEFRNDPHYEQRVDLTCAFRWVYRLDMHESVANHFSLSVSEDGSKFLINPNGRHFSKIRASELLLVDAHDRKTMSRKDAPDPTAWGLHGSLHRNCPHARCVMHAHPAYGTVLASLADSTMLPIDQNTARFYNRVIVDEGFGGMAFEEEGERCSKLLGNHKVMIMGNHGVLVAAPSVAEAFDDLYYFERAARNLILAYSTGKDLKLLSNEVAEKTARQWEDYATNVGLAHFSELKAILDEEEPDYRT
ncbi:MAG: class II aldolase and adducin N-terminal domain-containing protein [Arenicellales bacterium]|nr:class II aldolase and adducin N-terminal domain-containing protein [Arenicellales bacterium]